MPYTSKLTKKEKTEQKERALELLREWLKPGDTVYTSVVHVARSGMSRTIRAYIIQDNKPHEISGYVSSALEWSWDDNNYGVRVGGCGMDMGFHLVYSLSRRLFRDGFDCIKTDTVYCPSNDHSNYRGADVPKHHADGGYALRQAWL